MEKSKRKHENPFEKYLWQTEQVLWMGKPKGQRWQYFQRLSQPFSPIEHPYKADLVSIVTLGIVAGLLFCSMLLVASDVPYNGLLASMVLMTACITPLIAVLLHYIYTEEDVFYAITNRRILVLYDGRCRELLHELILKAGIKQHWHSENIAWDEGQVAFFPPFVGIEDAEYLVQLVENARHKSIPIVEKM